MPHRRLMERSLLAGLEERGIQLLAAVTPPEVDTAADLVLACRAAGISVGLWPMLDDASGRWASARSMAAFVPYVEHLLTELHRRTAMPDVLAVDLEPPIARTRRLLGSSAGPALMEVRPHPAIGDMGGGALVELMQQLHALGVETITAFIPALLCDQRRIRGWGRVLETPLPEAPPGRLAAMAYTSLFEGYSGGLLRRADARALLGAFCAVARRRWDGRAAIALGAVGMGALGDERVYRSPTELADDVAIARAAGVDDIALFDLGGALGRAPAERWLDALVHTEPAPRRPRLTPRAAAVLAALYGASPPLELAGRWLEGRSRRSDPGTDPAPRARRRETLKSVLSRSDVP